MLLDKTGKFFKRILSARLIRHLEEVGPDLSEAQFGFTINKMFLVVSIMMAAMTSSVLCYDAKYDEIDADAVIADDALFTSYLKCFLDKGPCTAKYAEEFKGLLSEVVTTACEKCTDSQKIKVRKIVKAIFETKTEMATEFRKKFDPNGEHEKNFLAFMDKKE